MYVALKTKYDTHSSTDCLKTVSANDVARSSFNPQALVAWTAMLWNRWSDLVNMQESFNAEYVAVLELLLAMKNQTYSPDWSKWARNYSMVKTEAKDFKVRKFLDNAVLAEKIEVLSKQHSQNKHKQAQTHLGHGCEKKSFKGGDNNGCWVSSKKQITCPCETKFVPRMPNHLICSFACKKASRKSAVSDLDRVSQLLGSRKAGQQLLDKAPEKDKNKWGKKNAGAHHASAKINLDDLSSESDTSSSDVSGSDDESDTAAAAAAHVKRGKSRNKRKPSKRKSRGVSANLAHVSKHAVILNARSSAAQVSKSAQVNAEDDDGDSDAETR